MTEKQLKYMNKVKAISFGILVAGLLLVLLWSIMKNKKTNKPVTPQPEAKVLAINYEKDGTKTKYDFTCATQECILSSQTGVYALIKDGEYKLVNLEKGTNKSLDAPTMNKNFMVAGDDFYGLVFTSDETNKASFYDAATGQTMYKQELNYEKMDEEEVRAVLNKMYPRKLFYLIKEDASIINNITTTETVLENVKDVFYYENKLYAINDKGLNLFNEDNTVAITLADAKEIYNAMYKGSIIILDKDGKIKTSTLDGTKGEAILEVGTNTVESVNVTNGILRVVLQDKDYETNKKVIKYEYDFETKKLNPIE